MEKKPRRGTDLQPPFIPSSNPHSHPHPHRIHPSLDPKGSALPEPRPVPAAPRPFVITHETGCVSPASPVPGAVDAARLPNSDGSLPCSEKSGLAVRCSDTLLDVLPYSMRQGIRCVGGLLIRNRRLYGAKLVSSGGSGAAAIAHSDGLVRRLVSTGSKHPLMVALERRCDSITWGVEAFVQRQETNK